MHKPMEWSLKFLIFICLMFSGIDRRSLWAQTQESSQKAYKLPDLWLSYVVDPNQKTISVWKSYLSIDEEGHSLSMRDFMQSVPLDPNYRDGDMQRGLPPPLQGHRYAFSESEGFRSTFDSYQIRNHLGVLEQRHRFLFKERIPIQIVPEESKERDSEDFQIAISNATNTLKKIIDDPFVKLTKVKNSAKVEQWKEVASHLFVTIQTLQFTVAKNQSSCVGAKCIPTEDNGHYQKEVSFDAAIGRIFIVKEQLLSFTEKIKSTSEIDSQIASEGFLILHRLERMTLFLDTIIPDESKNLILKLNKEKRLLKQLLSSFKMELSTQAQYEKLDWKLLSEDLKALLGFYREFDLETESTTTGILNELPLDDLIEAIRTLDQRPWLMSKTVQTNFAQHLQSKILEKRTGAFEAILKEIASHRPANEEKTQILELLGSIENASSICDSLIEISHAR